MVKALRYTSGLYQSAFILSLTGLMLWLSSAPASADSYERVYDARTSHYVYVPKKSWPDRLVGGIKNFCREPILKKTVIGSGVGVGTAAIAETNMLTGGLVGAGVGAGWAVLDDSKTMDRRPLIKSMSKGAMAGIGASVVTGGLGTLPGAAIGAGVGAAAHFIGK
ncbi:MAG TPA: hypothetical protein V6C99_05390 [Oculatellaceae cyanobacterium]|jgi:hypothetical protein